MIPNEMKEDIDDLMEKNEKLAAENAKLRAATDAVDDALQMTYRNNVDIGYFKFYVEKMQELKALNQNEVTRDSGGGSET